eukprot:IDg2449t1
MSVCLLCSLEVCEKESTRQILLEYGNSLQNRKAEEHEDSTNNLVRKSVYRFYEAEKYGVLGKQQRIQIPEFVLGAVRAAWLLKTLRTWDTKNADNLNQNGLSSDSVNRAL